MGRGGIREKRAPDKIGTGKILWADVSGVSRATVKTNGMAVRKDESGIWVRFSLAKWRWKTGVLANMAEKED